MFSDLILVYHQDLKYCVENDFPQGTELSSIEKDREAHISFAEARRRIYIGREFYFEQINHYMHSDNDKPFVILGESGYCDIHSKLKMP